MHQLALHLLTGALWLQSPYTLWWGNSTEPSFAQGPWTEVRWFCLPLVAHPPPSAGKGTSWSLQFFAHCQFYKSCRKSPIDFTPEIFLSSSQWAVLFICPQSKCYTRIYNQARFNILCIHCIHPHWTVYQSRHFILNTICHGAKGK